MDMKDPQNVSTRVPAAQGQKSELKMALKVKSASVPSLRAE